MRDGIFEAAGNSTFNSMPKDQPGNNVVKPFTFVIYDCL